MNGYVFLVTGSRYATQLNKGYIERVLFDEFNSWMRDSTLVVHGGCRGVDMIAENYCKSRGIMTKVFPYPQGYGRMGGPMRNQEMVNYCEKYKHLGYEVVCLAFPSIESSNNKSSTGTMGCIKMAQKAGIKVLTFPIRVVS